MRSKRIVKAKRNIYQSTKRGETIIEAMFAFAIFSLVAVLTVSLMNSGIATGERSLELVTARNELNAQAEALRFIHSSYISEKSLPECTDETVGQRNCQQYKEIWENITSNAVYSDSVGIDYPLSNCNEVYDRGLLASHSAFVLNTRQLLAHDNRIGVVYNDNDAYIPASSGLFRAAPLNARIIYTAGSTGSNSGDNDDNSTQQITTALTDYRKVASVEGIWIIPVQGPTSGGSGPQYYDFYIQTCWYGTDSPAPSSLDTIVRLYNPDGA